ncbi:MAG: hypothetical protein A3F83_13675 [Candidatus Glassbacteria bacterium RIFCSPLOWO2_12_FULL_58_11]|uniref:histidine kinase n=1 Tax=Candidatus Glassbacteria bacterium RIFCSPLOWO2_12_FULL_58_11 TaxID=1817867 RepID=A0A1F5YXL8_9BACT|nr:MAG: hypothetical protein A3F83_13675 [Candidatus Glassbacteria bacterium RIFCSPLOWO2_12_FULL_58_11]
MFRYTYSRLLAIGALQLVLPLYLFSQSLPIFNYTSDDGLPQSEVISIMQDSKGFIWFGTWGGVSRFDGRTFTNFTTAEGLIHNSVKAILEDSKGDFWFGTDKGASRFNGKTWQSFTSRDGLISDFISGILEDRSGCLWFATRDGVSRYDGSGWRTFTEKDGLAVSNVFSMLQDSQGSFWFGTLEGVTRYRGGRFETFTVKDGLTNNVVRSILEASPGEIWLGTQDGISIFDGASWRKYSTEDGLCDKYILSMVKDREGRIWCATRKGISYFAAGRWSVISEDQGLANNYVLKLLKDREGNLWFGTVGGVSRLNGLNFLNYTRKDGLASNSLDCIFEDSKGNMWFGTDAGLSRFNSAGWRTFTVRDGLGEMAVYGIAEADDGSLWFGTFGGGVSRFDGKNWRTFNQDNGLADNFINIALKDSRGVLWFGTHNGVSRFDGKEWRSFHAGDGPANPAVYGLCEDKSGNLWFGTYGGGISRFDGKNWRTFTAKDGLGSDFILTIFKDKNGKLWIGTDSGIAVYDGLSFRQFDPVEGLPKSACFTITERDNQFYFGTSHGLIRYDGSSIRWFNKSDGLISNQIVRNGAVMDRQGKLWLGTVSGVSFYDPELDRPGLVPPPVHITEVRSFDNRLLNNGCRLKFSEKHLKFNFTGICHSAPETVTYKYQLEGSSPEWYESAQNSVQYTHLPPGKYTFRVKAGNKDGAWSLSPAEFSFIIAPAFWSTWWFISLCAIGLGGMLYGIFKEGQKLKESKILKEKNIELHNALEFLKKEISERRQAEEALRGSEERFRFAVNNLPAVIWTVDPELKFTLSEGIGLKNLGLRTGEAVGKNLFEFFKTDDPEYLSIAMHLRALKGESVNYEQTFNNLTYAVHLEPLRDSLGNISGVYGIALDITESKLLEQERTRADKLESIGVLAGGIAHDFNNILTAILGNISLLKVLLPDDKKITEILTEAEHASLRARNLTQQLITFSKGGVPLRKICRLPGLLKEWSSFSLRGTNVKCKYSVPDNLWSVKVDENQISQVINNLVINASQAMPGGGEINIRAENITLKSNSHLPLEKGNYIKISVEDQGVGIAEEHLSKIFDPYFTTKQQGNGLGLTTSYSIVKKHEGHMEVQSRPGSGAVFSLYLPAAAEKAPKTVSSRSKVNNSRKKILFMDDDPAVREVALRILAELGHEAVQAGEGEQALDLYRNAAREGEPFDAVILDLTVAGGMGGRETMKKLLELDPDVRGIISSGYSDAQPLSEFRSYGFRGRIEKPYNIDELSQALENIFGD